MLAYVPMADIYYSLQGSGLQCRYEVLIVHICA